MGALDARALNGATVRVTMDFDANKKVKGIKRNIVVDAMALFLPGQYAVHRFMIPIRLTIV